MVLILEFFSRSRMFILVIFQANFHSCCYKNKCIFSGSFSLNIQQYNNIITFRYIVSKLIENQIKFHKISQVSWVEFEEHPFRMSVTDIYLGLHSVFGMLILNCSVLHDKWICCTGPSSKHFF